MEEELKEAIAHLEWLLNDGILASEDEPHIKMVLNRLEQDERVINDVANHLEYYLIGRLDLEDSQEEFKKLLKMLKPENEEECVPKFVIREFLERE